MRNILALALTVSLVGCKSNPKAAQIVVALPAAPVVIMEPEAIAMLRGRAEELKLQFFIRCEDDSPDVTDDGPSFLAVAWPRGADYANNIDGNPNVLTSHKGVPSWSAWGKSQEDAASKLHYALRFKPNSFPGDFHAYLPSHKKHVQFCPPEIRGE